MDYSHNCICFLKGKKYFLFSRPKATKILNKIMNYDIILRVDLPPKVPKADV